MLVVVTRAAAKAAGAKRYFTGKPCKHGHVSERLTNDGSCRECNKAKLVARHRRDPEKWCAKQRSRRVDDPAEARRRDREWRARNLEARRAYEREWAAANPDKVREKHLKRYWGNPDKERARSAKYSRVNASRRRQRIRDSGGENFTLADVLAILKAQRGKCAACKLKLSPYHIDHIVPLKRDGTNKRTNIQLLCPPCNMEKSAKDPVDFMRSRGLLL